jgi:hypothetical protein
MRLEIGFEGKNGSREYNWDPTRAKIQKKVVRACLNL